MERRDHHEQIRREMPKRPTYDYFRRQFGDTRYERVNRVFTRFETARTWIDEQIRAYTNLGMYSDQINNLVQEGYTSRTQALQGNNRFLNRSRDRDARNNNLAMFREKADAIEHLALRVLLDTNQQLDISMPSQIFDRLREAEEGFKFLEANNTSYTPLSYHSHRLSRDDFIRRYQRAYDEFRATVMPVIRSNLREDHFNTFMRRFGDFVKYRSLFENFTSTGVPRDLDPPLYDQNSPGGQPSTDGD